MTFVKDIRCACDSVALGQDSTFIWDEDGMMHGRMHCLSEVPG